MSANKFTFSCVRFLDTKYTDSVVQTKDIFYDNNVKQCIYPKSEDDYKKNHRYRVYVRSCGTECQPCTKHCSLYKAYIVCFGSKY